MFYLELMLDFSDRGFYYRDGFNKFNTPVIKHLKKEIMSKVFE
jgi:hypothetical protein